MAEKLIELNSVETALEIFGSRDENIRLLENEFSITAVCRGSQIKFTGEPEQVAAAARRAAAVQRCVQRDCGPQGGRSERGLTTEKSAWA